MAIRITDEQKKRSEKLKKQELLKNEILERVARAIAEIDEVDSVYQQGSKFLWVDLKEGLPYSIEIVSKKKPISEEILEDDNIIQFKQEQEEQTEQQTEEQTEEQKQETEEQTEEQEQEEEKQEEEKQEEEQTYINFDYEDDLEEVGDLPDYLPREEALF